MQTEHCPDTGDARRVEIQRLNILKNRHSLPKPEEIDRSVSSAKLFNSGDRPNAFNEHAAASIEGYILKAKEEKEESCNCHSHNPSNWDYHVYLNIDKEAHKIGESIVIEITPYTRKLHPEYTLEYIQHLKGKKVRISGWLMFDFEHLSNSYESHPEVEKVFRHTVWEIHPITSIEVIN